IVTLALLAFTYYRCTSGSISLAAIGLLAFSAVVHFAPAIFAALYWSGASRAGVFWGMLTGFIAWAYLLLLPNLAAGGLLPAGGLEWPALLQSWLPHALTDLPNLGSVGPRAILALGINIAVLLFVSARR